MVSALVLASVALLHCSSPPPPTSDAGHEDVAAILAELRASNKPRIVDGSPTDSVLDEAARERWCARLVRAAEHALARPGDAVKSVERCALEVAPAPARQLVAGVRVRFDAGFFFRKPYADASFDRETRTMFLPAAALEKPWDELPATQHEWLHASHDARARSGDPLALALATVISGPDYRPDAFHVDEVPVNICDLLRAYEGGGAPQAWQIEMTKHYVGLLRDELRAMKSAKGGTPERRAALAGTRLGAPSTTTPATSTVRWVAGDVGRTLALLGDVLTASSMALARLEASPPDVAGARAIPLYASGLCTPAP